MENDLPTFGVIAVMDLLWWSGSSYHLRNLTMPGNHAVYPFIPVIDKTRWLHTSKMWPFPLLCIVLSSVRDLVDVSSLRRKILSKQIATLFHPLFYFLMAVFDLDNDSLQAFHQQSGHSRAGGGIYVHNTSHQHLLCISTLDLVPFLLFCSVG